MFESDFLTPAPESREAYEKLISTVVRLVRDSWPGQPYSGKTPAQLADLVPSDFLPQFPGTIDQLAGTLRTVISNSVCISHTHVAAHLHCPPLLPALASEVVISTLNQSMDSFDQAPIATVAEQKLIRWLCSEMAFPPTSSGTFTTGGSQSNYMGLLLAREHCLQKHWQWSAQRSGLPPDARRLRILCSEVAHFTVEKSAAQLGLGTDSVVKVAVDDDFRMTPGVLTQALHSLAERDFFPMAVVATAGTTDFGSIDPLSEIASIAHAANAWLHVDAAYGGALLFSPQYRSKLAGIDAADSVSIDFHKLFWQPIPCSAFLVRNADHLELIKMHADYLNPEQHEDAGIPNLVTTSLLTSRRFDALKLWISFQALGREKLASLIDRTIALASHAADVIQRTPALELVARPAISTVVFRYVPKSGDTEKINAAIPSRLFERGTAVLGHTRVRERQCLKFTCMNPTAAESDLEAVIRLVVNEGTRLETEAGT